MQIVYMAPMKALAAEMADTFGKRLAPLGVRVKECTGDMQLTAQEILETQVSTYMWTSSIIFHYPLRVMPS